MSRGTSPEVGFCTGKDCRKADGFRTVERELRQACTVREVSCLDVCDGPVVVIEPRGKAPVVIERVRSRAVVLELIDCITDGGEMSGRLRKRVLSGSKRAKARRRLARVH